MSEYIVDTVKVNGFEMDYMKFGKGQKVLVILPGMSLMSVMPLALYCVNIYKIFTEDYTVYLFDRRKDFGPDYSIEEMASDMAVVMKSLNLANADFLAISQGGMIAQVMAEKFPELVHKMALASSASRTNATSKAVFEEWIRLAKSGDTDALVSLFIDKVYTEKSAKLCKQAAIDANHAATERDKRNFIVMANSCMKRDGYEELSEIKCPTFVLGGALDQVLTGEASLEMYEKLKANGTPCELYMYNDCGHAIYDEVTGFRERVLEFFKKA